MTKLRLVDGNSVGRAAHAGVKLKAGSMQTQAIFNSIKGARAMLMAAPDYPILWTWDGHAQWRYDLFPEYKSKRDDTPEKVKDRAAYTEQKPHIIRALSALGIRQIMSEADEADDLAGYFVSATKKKDPNAQIILTTGDEDWVQLLRDGVTWEDHRDATKRINLENLFDKTGYRTPYLFLEGKCLTGDSSDKIPGVGGLGEKRAPEFIAEFGSVGQFWAAVRDGKFKPRLKVHQRLASPEGKATFARNLQMMQLIKPRPLQRELITNFPAKFDRAEFLDICGEFAFLSILRDADTFLRPFELAAAK